MSHDISSIASRARAQCPPNSDFCRTADTTDMSQHICAVTRAGPNGISTVAAMRLIASGMRVTSQMRFIFRSRRFPICRELAFAGEHRRESDRNFRCELNQAVDTPCP
jgi:hypothetical protein